MKTKFHLSLFLLFTIVVNSNAHWQETSIDDQSFWQLSSLSSSQEKVTSYASQPLTIDIRQSNAAVMLSLTELSFVSSASATELTIIAQYPTSVQMMSLLWYEEEAEH